MELNLRIENAIPITCNDGSTLNLDKLNCSGIEVTADKKFITLHMNNGKSYNCQITETGLVLNRIF